MKKVFIAFGMLLMTTTAANAGGIISKHASSVQLTVDAARTDASRIGSSFSISGSNIDTAVGDDANVVSAGTIASGVYSPGTVVATQDTPGTAFSFSQSLVAILILLLVMMQTLYLLELLHQVYIHQEQS